MIAPGVEVSLQEVGIAFAEFGAVAGGKAVAETNDDGTRVVDCCGGLLRGRRCFRSGNWLIGHRLVDLLCEVIVAAACEDCCQCH